MSRTITFSFSSKKYEDTETSETFTFEKLGIDEDIDDQELEKVIDELFQAWVWEKLNISYSIIINEDDDT